MVKKIIASFLSVILICSQCFVCAYADAPMLPQFTEMYQGVSSLKLAELKDKEGRRYARTGPAKTFTLAGGYKPHQIIGITAYFIEEGWVYSLIKYQTIEDRYSYLPAGYFKNLPRDLPSASSRPAFIGKTTEDLIPSWGPGSKYIRHENYAIPAGTQIAALFQENGYTYSEFVAPEGLVRMWLPNNRISVDSAKLIITSDSYIDGKTGRRYYTPAKKENDDGEGENGDIPEAPDGNWSAWTDTPIPEREGIEVQTRTVYRMKVEIEDWSDWTDGDAPDNPVVETRTIIRDGVEVHQWRDLWYHYHYGDWSDWSENLYRQSSTDIVESKVQYRYRNVN